MIEDVGHTSMNIRIGRHVDTQRAEKGERLVDRAVISTTRYAAKSGRRGIVFERPFREVEKRVRLHGLVDRIGERDSRSRTLVGGSNPLTDELLVGLRCRLDRHRCLGEYRDRALASVGVTT